MISPIKLLKMFFAAPRWAKMVTSVLAVGGLGVVGLVGFGVAFVATAWLGQPIPVLGFEQTFEQPIAFPHPPHTSSNALLDELGNSRTSGDGSILYGAGLNCVFCHSTVENEASAGIPSLELCSACHAYLGPESEALTTLREASGIIGENPYDVNWRRVHRLPDHVRFVHQPHIDYLTSNPSAIDSLNTPPDISVLSASSVLPMQVCSTCHGDVGAMEQVFQVEDLKMGTCVNCHKENEAPTDCATCHN